MWTLDERVGCVAIYSGERRNCLAGIATDPTCVFWAMGKYAEKNGWSVDPVDVERARRCFAALSAGEDKEDAERWRWGNEHARWIRHEHEAYVAIPVARDANLSSRGSRQDAVDKAMRADLAAPAPQEEDGAVRDQFRRFVVAVFSECVRAQADAAVVADREYDEHDVLRAVTAWANETRVLRAMNPAPPAREETSGAALIAAERQRQVTACGWTPEHDDQHKDGALAKAAACYALEGLPRALRYRRVRDGCTMDYQRDDGMISVPNLWPWAAEDWNVKNRLSNLVRAGALIAAEIDRLLRAKLCPQHEGVPGGQGCTCLAGTYAGQIAGRAHDAGCPSAPASATCAMVPVRADVIAFLNGDTQLDGLWFGDVWFGKHRPAGKGAFWWRKYLPAAPPSAPEDARPTGGE